MSAVPAACDGSVHPDAPPGRYLWRRHLLSCHPPSSWELKLGLGSRTRPAHLPPDSPSVALPTAPPRHPNRRVFPLFLPFCHHAARLGSAPRRTAAARHSALYLFCTSALFLLLSSMRGDAVVCGGQLSPLSPSAVNSIPLVCLVLSQYK